MPTYNPPLRDMQFVMHELLNVSDEFKAIPRHTDVDANTKAGGVHHHEHGLHALVGLPHQGAIGPVQYDLGCCVAMDAHLVFQTGTIDAVSLTK